MTVLTDTQVVTASGGLVELGNSLVTTDTTITSITAGSGTTVVPDFTVVCDGSPVLVEFFANNARPTAALGSALTMSLYHDGSERVRGWGYVQNASSTNIQYVPVYLSYRMTPTAGSHTFGMKAYGTVSGSVVAGGTGTSTTNAPAMMRVSKIVQATQWPAVTTGTIICTSSTRPASPFAGQKIWETDTSKEYTYTGSAWTESSYFRTAGSAVVDNYRVPPSCMVRRTTSITGYTSGTAISWESAAWDTESSSSPMWASSPNPTRVTIRTAGLYVVTLNAYESATATLSVMSGNINLNGTRVASAYASIASGTTGIASTSTTLSLSAGDYLEANVTNINGSAYVVGGAASMTDQQTRMAVTLLGQAS